MANALVGLLQLVLLAVFVCSVFYLNTYRPANTHYRPFRIRWWVPTVAGGMALLFLGALVNVPHHLQHTNALVARRHAEGRAECQSLMEQGAQHSERAALFASEFFRDKTAPPHPKAPSTVFAVLSPLLNLLLFNSGVTICAVPLLAYLVFLHLRRPSNNSSSARQSWLDLLRRESGVLLPVLNLICLVSAFTAPTFYLFIQPGRVDRCMYTSGHWFTFSVTLLTFAVIVSHLASYQRYCRSSGLLLALFAVWLAVYAMCALPVLKRTQEAFHDSREAVDGIRQALPAFAAYMVFFVAVQYITFISTDKDTDADTDTAADNSETARPQNVSQKDSAAAMFDETAVVKPSKPQQLAKKQQQQQQQTAVVETTTSTLDAIPDAPEAPALSDIPDAPPPPPPMSAAVPPAPRAPVVKRRAAASASASASTSASSAPALASAASAATDGRSVLLDDIKARSAKLRPAQSRQLRPQPELSGVQKWLTEARKVLQPDGEDDDTRDDGWDE